MIKSNRVIQTTIFVVFLFVVLSLPIFNKSGVIFVQIAKADGYEQCKDEFNNFSSDDLVGMCRILESQNVKPFVPGSTNWLSLSTYFPCLTEQEFKGSMWDAEKQGIWHLHATYKTYDEYLIFLKQNLRTVIKMVCNDPAWTKVKSIGILCNFCKNPSERTEFDKYIGIIKQANPVPLAQQIQIINKPADCLEEYTELNIITALSPGRLIRGVFAGIAIGLRGILGFVSDAFVWAFTGLPQKLGGYIHFKPIYDPDTNTGIWKVMQTYANLGIIIAMIFMAIATILRIEKYSWKRMLWKILLVALLINFSLVILGIFVDISNFLSVYFLSATTNNQLGNTIENVVTGVSCALAGPDSSKFVPTMTGTTVAIILSGIFLFQFAGLLFYVASRIITIWVCAATSPFAFLAMAFDVEPIKKAVDMWRDRFTQAIVSLPILSFTLYFVLLILGGENGIATQINQKNLGFIMLMAYTVVIIALAQVLRFVAKSIGIEQIEQGYAFAKKAVTGIAMAGAAAVGGFALGKALTSGAWKKTQEKLQKSNIQPLYGIGNWMDRQSDKFTKARAKPAEEFLKTQTKEGVRHYMEMARGRKDAMGVALAVNELIERKKLKTSDYDHVDFARNVPFLDIKGLKKTNPYIYQRLSIPETTIKAYTADVKAKNPTYNPQQIQDVTNQELSNRAWKQVLIQARGSTTKDLAEGYWQDILEAASKRPDFDKFLYNLEENTTPEGLATIFKTLEEKSLKRYVDRLVTVVIQNNPNIVKGAGGRVMYIPKTRQEAVDYLLRPPTATPPGKGFGTSRWWRSMLH